MTICWNTPILYQHYPRHPASPALTTDGSRSKHRRGTHVLPGEFQVRGRNSQVCRRNSGLCEDQGIHVQCLDIPRDQAARQTEKGQKRPYFANSLLNSLLAWISQIPVTLRRAEAPASVILAVTKSRCDGIRNALARGSRIASPPAAASRNASH